MLVSFSLCVALIQAEPGLTPKDNRFQSPTSLIDMSDYHPTVDYIPHIIERRPAASSLSSSLAYSTVPYELVAHHSVTRSQKRATSTPIPLTQSPSRMAAPKLHASFKIPVPDDLTMIQPKPHTDASAVRVVVGPTKTSIPRIERILGIDSAHLPATTSASRDLKTAPPISDEIPVPSLGS